MSNERIAAVGFKKAGNAALACLAALLLAGCMGDDNDSPQSPAATPTPTPPTSVTPSPPPAPPPNSAPSISGTPTTSAKVNVAYSFQPAASDPDGDLLTFAIVNKPAWATFNASTGLLGGTPSSSSTGAFSDVRISVTDGKTTASLPAFTINVAGDALGSATLKWQPPTSNTDGSPLTNLAGYVIRYGTSPTNLATEVRISNAGLTTYVVSELVPATWYFQVSAFNSSGVESAPSATASKTIA
jgi:hypothetical protein